MKMMWFHLMPYTELPDDFREKHPSVWVDIHSSLFDPRRATMRRSGEEGGEGMPEGLRAIDCDVHPMVPAMSALAPYLDEFWRDQVVERGITSLDGQSWPIRAPKAPVLFRNS